MDQIPQGKTAFADSPFASVDPYHTPALGMRRIVVWRSPVPDIATVVRTVEAIEAAADTASQSFAGLCSTHRESNQTCQDSNLRRAEIEVVAVLHRMVVGRIPELES
jgi:hypothetical protein